jgi:hypothetical protein
VSDSENFRKFQKISKHFHEVSVFQNFQKVFKKNQKVSENVSCAEVIFFLLEDRKALDEVSG